MHQGGRGCKRQRNLAWPCFKAIFGPSLPLALLQSSQTCRQEGLRSNKDEMMGLDPGSTSSNGTEEAATGPVRPCVSLINFCAHCICNLCIAPQ